MRSIAFVAVLFSFVLATLALLLCGNEARASVACTSYGNGTLMFDFVAQKCVESPVWQPGTEDYGQDNNLYPTTYVRASRDAYLKAENEYLLAKGAASVASGDPIVDVARQDALAKALHELQLAGNALMNLDKLSQNNQYGSYSSGGAPIPYKGDFPGAAYAKAFPNGALLKTLSYVTVNGHISAPTVGATNPDGTLIPDLTGQLGWGYMNTATVASVVNEFNAAYSDCYSANPVHTEDQCTAGRMARDIRLLSIYRGMLYGNAIASSQRMPYGVHMKILSFDSTDTFSILFSGGPVQTTTSQIAGTLRNQASIVAGTGPATDRAHERLGGQTGGSSVASLFAGDRPATSIGSGLQQGTGSSAGSTTNYDAVAGTGSLQSPIERSLGFALPAAMRNGNGMIDFSTSLNSSNRSLQPRGNLLENHDGPSRHSVFSISETDKGAADTSPEGRFNIWTEGRTVNFSRSTIDGKTRGIADLISTGADYVINPNLLVGAMSQFDWNSDSNSDISQSHSGQGWMAGPYVSTRIWQDLFFDGRAAWGKSANKISPFGLYEDTFDTQRTLIDGKISREFLANTLSIRPSIGLTYYSETQNAYTDANGLAIDSSTNQLGRLTFGSEFSRSFDTGNKSAFELMAGAKGIWDFYRTDIYEADETIVLSPNLKAQLELGAAYRLSNGMRVRVAGDYDGIGSSSDQTWQGRLAFEMPFK